MAPITTKKAKDLAQETSPAKIKTAKAIIWNTGGELKQVAASALVNENVTKDAIPTRDSANPVESGGVYAALEGKDDKATVVEFEDGDDNYTEDNWMYVGVGEISDWQLMGDASDKTFAISFDTAASGAVTITLPSSVTFTEAPVFGNSEHWEIAVRNGYGVWVKYDLS